VTTFGVPLDQVNAAHLESLRTNAVAEGRQLEYKEQLPISVDDDKREFLADVTSFANTAGGDIIYGVREARDAADKQTGIPEKIVGLAGINIEQLKLTLDNLLRDAVDPRVPGIALQTIPRGSEPPCLLVRAPKSALGLHMVTFKGLGRFYGRGTAGRYVLDRAQIRDGFVAADTAVDRVRRFRRERLAAVLSGDTPIPIGTRPKAIFHALPLAAAPDTWARFLTGNESNKLAVDLPTLESAASIDWRYNLDGFVVHTARRDLETQSYVQVFRDGGIEAVSPNVVAIASNEQGFYGLPLERAMIAGMAAYQRLWAAVGVTGPVMAALALSGIKGAAILAGPQYGFDPKPFTVDVVNVPDVVILDATMPSDQALKPLVDIVWNGGGWPRSPFYDDATGKWMPPRR